MISLAQKCELCPSSSVGKKRNTQKRESLLHDAHQIHVPNPLTDIGFQPANPKCKALGTEFSNSSVLWLEALFCPIDFLPPRWEGYIWSGFIFTGEDIAEPWVCFDYRMMCSEQELCHLASLNSSALGHVVPCVTQRTVVPICLWLLSVWKSTFWLLFPFYEAGKGKRRLFLYYIERWLLDRKHDFKIRSEGSQTWRDRYCMISLICGI